MATKNINRKLQLADWDEKLNFRRGSKISNISKGSEFQLRIQPSTFSTASTHSNRSYRRLVRSRSRVHSHHRVMDENARIIHEILTRKFKPHDSRDLLDIDPSYTHFTVPYEIECAARYNNMRQTYERQFKREIQLVLDNAPSALEMVRLRRTLGITSLWPPLHNRRELIYTQKHLFHPKKKARIYYLLENKIF